MHGEMCWHYYDDGWGLQWSMSYCLDVPQHLRVKPSDRQTHHHKTTEIELHQNETKNAKVG